MKQPSDFSARTEALDISRSFIVKAPAGSGKTTLLVKRYLKLLSVVNAPEEIIAITFTRKAASEMIDRVLAAIKLASQGAAEHDDKELIKCARQALEQNDKKQWQLLTSPARIRIQTIDALSQHLVRQMPWSAGFGAAPSAIDDDVGQHYLSAARQALLSALSDNQLKTSAQDLLLALDNNFTRACELLVSMLDKRDQWQQLLISELSADDARQRLEKSWSHVVEQALIACDNKLDAQLKQDLLMCAHYAAENLAAKQPDSPIVKLKEITSFPTLTLEQVSNWRALSFLLLTAAGDLRKRIDVNAGFPSKSDSTNETKKILFKSVLERISELGLEKAFRLIQNLPEFAYSEREWQLLSSLTHILKLAVAELTVIFQQQGVCDHIEIATRANLALGQAEDPTDLALRLDYRIQHLLVDEFQDTSHTQIELFKRLTGGWQAGDGRTLFFVGDPMQSIYRFREADVSIFLDVYQQGFNALPLSRLELTENFRSAKTIVDWVNHKFTGIFPANDGQQTTTVNYSSSSAYKPEREKDHLVKIHVVDKNSEADAVCQLTRSILAVTDNKQTIGLLVRSRKHLDEIVTLFNEQAVDYQGVKLQKLSRLSCIQDIYALTKALCHLGDRLSWLAILRAPWCGLDLPSLTTVSAKAQDKTIWQALDRVDSGLDAEMAARVELFRKILGPALIKLGKCSLHDLVSQVWQALGGADTISINDQVNINTYLQLLNQIETAGQIKQFDQFDRAIDELWASSDAAQARLQLMTIHTAKGLEFDSVILPGLYKKPRVDEAKLLIWNEFTVANQTSLLLSPIKINNQDNRRYDFIRSLEKNMQREEDKRLLYVACTRAIQQLHLFVSVKPDAASLQSLMQNQIQDEIDSTEPQLIEDSAQIDKPIIYRRLPTEYLAPTLPKKLSLQTSLNDSDRLVEYQWAGITAIHLGTLAHEIICRYAEQGEAAVSGKLGLWRNRLLALGVGYDQLDSSILLIKQALQNIQTDERGKWILSQTHKDQHNEWQLTSHHHLQLENNIIDRTFIDDQGVRWIIDYKTSTHEGGNIEAFLDSEQQRYRGQLENYAAVLRLNENNPIKLGLYFPMLAAWREWPYID